MEKIDATLGPARRALTAAVGLLAAALLAGACGDEDDYENNLRPPVPINVAAYISPTKVSVSPARFGAGPIVVIVTNQSDGSQEVTFENDDLATTGGVDVAQTTGPINPGDTGQIKLDVAEGSYRVRVGNQSIRPALVEVGPKRESGQNEVLQP